METDIIVGCLVGVGALTLITCLVLWSRRTIDRIAKSRSRSAREILKELHGGR